MRVDGSAAVCPGPFLKQSRPAFALDGKLTAVIRRSVIVPGPPVCLPARASVALRGPSVALTVTAPESNHQLQRRSAPMWSPPHRPGLDFAAASA